MTDSCLKSLMQKTWWMYAVFHLLRQAFVCWTTAVPTTSQGNLETELAWQNTPDTFTEAQYLQHVQTKGLRQVWTGFAHEMQWNPFSVMCSASIIFHMSYYIIIYICYIVLFLLLLLSLLLLFITLYIYIQVDRYICDLVFHSPWSRSLGNCQAIVLTKLAISTEVKHMARCKSCNIWTKSSMYGYVCIILYNCIYIYMYKRIYVYMYGNVYIYMCKR